MSVTAGNKLLTQTWQYFNSVTGEIVTQVNLYSEYKIFNRKI